jgi:hypothetical protein
MTATIDPELANVEERALAGLEGEDGHLEAGLEKAAAQGSQDGGDDEQGVSPRRLAIAVAFPVLAAAVMVGGVFTGVGGRVYAGVAGLLGIALAYALSRMKRAAATNVLAVVGLFGIGLLLVAPTGLGNVAGVATLASQAAKQGSLTRPPVPMLPGWQAIIGWLLGVVGFTAAWVALVLKRPPLALLVPLPVAAIAGISVPKVSQVASGISVLVLFAVGLGIMSASAEVGDAGERLPRSYQILKVLEGFALIAVITGVLIALASTHILFPRPLVDPAQQPQRPKVTPPGAVTDRVLFTVKSASPGPWRMGSLDVYDGKGWRLPPFAQNRLKDVPRTGIVNKELAPGVRATFDVAGLTGAVLPSLPNAVGIVADGPKLAYDSRSGNIRLSQGQVQAGLSYTVVAAVLPSPDDLKKNNRPVPPEMQQFTKVPSPPPAVVSLLDQARAAGPDPFSQFFFMHDHLLATVTAAGPGMPIEVPPERVQAMLANPKPEATPFEIVAADALLARWLGVPSRIGYGFDGGNERPDGSREVRPGNGATFVELYFPGYEWLPIIGQPRQVRPTVGTDPGKQQVSPNSVPSDDIAIELFLPAPVKPPSILAKQLARALEIVVPILLLLYLLYVCYPAIRKAVVRARRRSRAAEIGPRARLALAYAEWRDVATDYGYGHTTDTPLMFLDRFVPDDEHTELAWLTTRAVWGDLRDEVGDDHVAVAEELSRALRRRLAAAQPGTVRAIAAISRLSLRDPYAPDLNDLLHRKERAHATS